MYSSIPQINQLTRLLIDHGLHHAVVCPGSRNAPIVHNLQVASLEKTTRLKLYSVTDERSAGFTALGIALAANEATAVCVTSGTALLNLLPAVAEAYYRGVTLIVVSADRPEAWIDRLDGQTIRQAGALMPYAPTCQLREPGKGDEADTLLWHNNCLLNNALLPLKKGLSRIIHINVPISEPLFEFNMPELPNERNIHVGRLCPPASADGFLPLDDVDNLLKNARLPALIFGQYDKRLDVVDRLERENQMLVCAELISQQTGAWRMATYDMAGGEVAKELPCPDIVVQAGGHLVHKQLKLLLRKQPACKVIYISERPAEEAAELWPDITQHLACYIEGNTESVLTYLQQRLPKNQSVASADKKLRETYNNLTAGAPPSFATLLKKALSERRARGAENVVLHLANSSAVREASKWLTNEDAYFECNRGTNGIDGSVSTAVGYASVNKKLNLLVTGDLSFFYDSNGLWNNITHNLRILVLNDFGGSIFKKFSLLKESPAYVPYVTGEHASRCRGVAESMNIGVRTAANEAELAEALDFLLDDKAEERRIVEFLPRSTAPK